MKTARAPSLAELRRALQAPLAASVPSPREVLRVGLDAFDHLLEGGFPRGAISVLSGFPGAGRMSLAVTLLARETRSGHPVAWIDAKATLYPPALALMGVDLGRLLMVRGVEERRSVYAMEQIVGSGAFSVVVASGLDRGLTSPRLRRIQTSAEGARVCVLLIVDPASAVSIRAARLKLRVQRRANGVLVEVEKNRALGPGKRAFLACDQLFEPGAIAT